MKRFVLVCLSGLLALIVGCNAHTGYVIDQDTGSVTAVNNTSVPIPTPVDEKSIDLVAYENSYKNELKEILDEAIAPLYENKNVEIDVKKLADELYPRLLSILADSNNSDSIFEEVKIKAKTNWNASLNETDSELRRAYMRNACYLDPTELEYPKVYLEELLSTETDISEFEELYYILDVNKYMVAPESLKEYCGLIDEVKNLLFTPYQVTPVRSDQEISSEFMSKAEEMPILKNTLDIKDFIEKYGELVIILDEFKIVPSDIQKKMDQYSAVKEFIDYHGLMQDIHDNLMALNGEDFKTQYALSVNAVSSILNAFVMRDINSLKGNEEFVSYLESEALKLNKDIISKYEHMIAQDITYAYTDLCKKLSNSHNNKEKANTLSDFSNILSTNLEYGSSKEFVEMISGYVSAVQEIRQQIDRDRYTQYQKYAAGILDQCVEIIKDKDIDKKDKYEEILKAGYSRIDRPLLAYQLAAIYDSIDIMKWNGYTESTNQALAEKYAYPKKRYEDF